MSYITLISVLSCKFDPKTSISSTPLQPSPATPMEPSRRIPGIRQEGRTDEVLFELHPRGGSTLQASHGPFFLGSSWLMFGETRSTTQKKKKTTRV